VCGVRGGAEGGASTLGVELPDEAGVAAKTGWGGDEEDVVVAPEAVDVAEGGEAGGGGEAGADDGDDAGGLGEVRLERGDELSRVGGRGGGLVRHV